MFADGGAREIDVVTIAGYTNEAEVAGAAADVADQHYLAVEQELAGASEVVGDPGIESCGGFFEQCQFWDSGFGGGGDGQLAGFLIERCRDGEDDVVIGDGARLRGFPGFANLGEKAGRDVYRRQYARAFGGIP